MSSVNVGIIGAGFIAKKHLSVLIKIKYFNLYGITSKTNKNCKKLKKIFNIKKIYANYNVMTNDEKIDCFIVCVSPNNIYKVIKKVIVTKKPFFTEKPIGINYDEAIKVKKLITRYKNLNMVGFNRRYYSIFHKAIKLIERHGGIKAINIEGHERIWKIKR